MIAIFWVYGRRSLIPTISLNFFDYTYLKIFCFILFYTALSFSIALCNINYLLPIEMIKVGKSSNIVFLCLPSEEVTKNVLFGERGLVNSSWTDYTKGLIGVFTSIFIPVYSN